MTTSRPVLSTVRGRLDYGIQREMVCQTRRLLRDAPLVRPETPSGMPMRVKVSAAGTLGWTGSRDGYRYSKTQRSGHPWPGIPEQWTNLASRFGGAHPWDSCIINWYEPGASLGWHQDLSEHDRSYPIVTVSLGDSCSWAVKPSVDGHASRCVLDSGQVTVLQGESRSWYHTVERIIPSPILSPLGATRGRVSLTFRVAGLPP